jgi:hypothetical protein
MYRAVASLSLAALGVAAAGPARAASTTTITVTSPLQYSSLPAGPVNFTGHATDSVGVKSVNTVITENATGQTSALQAVLAEPNAPSTDWSLTWQPPRSGSYNISVVAIGTSGGRSTRIKVFFDVAAPSGPAYLSLVMSRSQWAVADSKCRAMPGAVPLGQVATTMATMGIPISGSVVTSYTSDASPSCITHGSVHDLYPTWTELGQLRDIGGMTFTSAGVDYVDDTTLTSGQLLANICGSLIPLFGHGHTKAWAIYAYPNNHYTTSIQAQVTENCFAFGRTYSSTRANGASLATPPYFQKTFSILGGACNNPAMPCYTLPVIGAVTGKQTFYTPVDQLSRLMQAGSGEWSVVQMYKFVTGSFNPGATSGLSWDCTAPDWHDHYVSDTESYCWNDFLAAIATIPSSVTVAQPDAVAKAFGPSLTAPTTTITSGPNMQNGDASVTFTFTSSDPRSWFACSLDGTTPAACVSPLTLSAVGGGPHTFTVQATDAYGLAGNRARASWSH